MKRNRICLTIICVITFLLTLVVCNQNDRTDNVFDELYYEVESVKKGQDSVLLTGTRTAYADCDLGAFENIQIPDLDMCLDYDNKSLYILFFNHNDAEKWDTSFCVLYRYDVAEKKLYGERNFDYLNENFLSHYIEWCSEASGKNSYSSQFMGDYTFMLQETVNFN